MYLFLRHVPCVFSANRRCHFYPSSEPVHCTNLVSLLVITYSWRAAYLYIYLPKALQYLRHSAACPVLTFVPEFKYMEGDLKLLEVSESNLMDSSALLHSEGIFQEGSSFLPSSPSAGHGRDTGLFRFHVTVKYKSGSTRLHNNTSYRHILNFF